MLCVEERAVPEQADVNIDAQQIVHRLQGVEVEQGSHALGVVVGRLDNAGLLDEVHAHEQRVTGSGHQSSHLRKEAAPLARVKVSDGRA